MKVARRVGLEKQKHETGESNFKSVLNSVLQQYNVNMQSIQNLINKLILLSF